MIESVKNITKFDTWILASRPKTLLAAVVPVVTGTSIVSYETKVNFIASAVALLCSVLIQVGTNFVNDLYDYLSGADSDTRKGPTRALASGMLTVKEMKFAIFLVFAVTFILGLYLVYISTWITLLIGLLSIFAGIAYTAGPYPLAYNGLGDVFVFLFFGIIGTVGTYYVQVVDVSALVLWSSIPVGALITNILVVNNYRDIDEDREVGKNTLAVKMGRKFTRYQYLIFMILSYLILFVVYFTYNQRLFVFLPLLTLPLAIKLIRMIFHYSGNELNKTLELTAKLSAFYGFLFCGWNIIMKIVELKYKQFTFPLKNQLNNSKQTIQSKDAIILKAIDSNGEIYFGEVSPLYGFSKETIFDCKDVLDNIIQDKSLLKNVNEIKNDLLLKIKLPSLLFGLESILFQMENKQKIRFEKNRVIENNAIIGIDDDVNNLEKIQQFIKSRFDTIKLKVGSDFDQELNLIKLINQRYGNSIKLRLDVNGNWNYAEAIENIHKLEEYNIQYIEQPVKDKNELIELAKTIKIDIAPDESIENIKDAEEFINFGNFNFIVLKPSIRMGIYDTIKIIELASENSINVIITSAYETVIGKAMLLYLASLTNHNYAHGLNTETLGVDIFDSSTNYNLPKINLDQNLFSYQINDDIL